MKTMQKLNKFKTYALIMATVVTLSSCSNDDNNDAPVNEEELITTSVCEKTIVCFFQI